MTLEKIKNTAIGRLLIITTGTSLVILTGVFVRFPVSTLGICSVLLCASALIIVEYNSRDQHEEKPSSPISPISGQLLQAPVAKAGSDEEAWATFRDMAAVVAVVCMIASLSFESFKSFQWTYRPAEGAVGDAAVPKQVKIYLNEWNAMDDFYGIIIECAKAALVLLMVSPDFFYPYMRHRGGAFFGSVHTNNLACDIERIVSLPI
jgi:hypothetical protein